MCLPVLVVLVTFVPAKSKLNAEATREARAREQARGAQGPRDPEQAIRGGKGGRGRGGGRAEGKGASGADDVVFLACRWLMCDRRLLWFNRPGSPAPALPQLPTYPAA